MMNQTIRNLFLILLLIVSVFLAPALIAGSIMEDIPGEDERADGDEFSLLSNFPVLWFRMPVYQMSVFLRLGMSIFVLCIVYLGGRSKNRRFNDRTLDAINVLKANFLKTARIRAVFDSYSNLHPTSAGGKEQFVQIMKTLISFLTLLMGTPVRGIPVLAPAKASRMVQSRPIFIRRVKL
jgi:hypothetical protein